MEGYVERMFEWNVEHERPQGESNQFGAYKEWLWAVAEEDLEVMTRAASVLTVCALMMGASAAAQIHPFPNSVRPAEGWPEEVVEIYQPIFTDSTLLFGKPWLVWHCICSTPDDYEFYYDVDMSSIRKCWGRKEVFDRVEVNGVYSFVQKELGPLYATIEPSVDGFLYTEVHLDSTETAAPVRTIRLLFDTDHVLRTDTSTMYKWNSEELTTRLTRYVELKPAD